MLGLEQEIALDAEPEREPDRLEFGERETSEFGATEAEIGKAELCRARSYVERA